MPCSVEQVPSLAHDLEMVKTTGAELAFHALRKLFALSEHATPLEDIRREMVGSTTLVSVLLQYLERCLAERSDDGGQQPQFILALMILNNISIPVPNKRLIAIEYKGIEVLSKLLCEEPSYGLLSIILVNLTFSMLPFAVISSRQRKFLCLNLLPLLFALPP